MVTDFSSIIGGYMVWFNIALFRSSRYGPDPARFGREMSKGGEKIRSHKKWLERYNGRRVTHFRHEGKNW
jgi:hypothetical protein